MFRMLIGTGADVIKGVTLKSADRLFDTTVCTPVLGIISCFLNLDQLEHSTPLFRST